jgi:hypothetical protein
MFIPAVDLESTGNVIFIVASGIIMLAQGWKLVRQGMVDANLAPDTPRAFNLINYGLGSVRYGRGPGRLLGSVGLLVWRYSVLAWRHGRLVGQLQRHRHRLRLVLVRRLLLFLLWLVYALSLCVHFKFPSLIIRGQLFVVYGAFNFDTWFV